MRCVLFETGGFREKQKIWSDMVHWGVFPFLGISTRSFVRSFVYILTMYHDHFGFIWFLTRVLLRHPFAVVFFRRLRRLVGVEVHSFSLAIERVCVHGRLVFWRIRVGH